MSWLLSKLRVSGIDNYYAIIVTATLFLNACYVYEWHQHCSNTLLFPEHATQVGYNFYRYNTITRLYQCVAYQNHGVVGAETLINRPPNIKDTIGYGFLLGLLWKITQTTSFYWIIALQVLLFMLSMCALFQALTWFYEDRQKALCAIFGVLAFLPGIYLNVQPVKDMWSFYGTVALLWSIVGLMQKKISNKQLCATALFFGICQWMRPTLFGVLMAFIVVGLPVLYYFFSKQYGALKKLLLFFLIANMCVFWIPWMTYNKVTFNRFFVGPRGLALLVSLGTAPNKWRIEPTEDFVGRHVKQNYPDLGYPDETQEFDNAAKELFIKYFKEDPLVYFKNLSLRVLQVFVINPPWTARFEEFWKYNVYDSKYQAFQKACEKGFLEAVRCGMFFLYVRFFLLLSYIGFVLLVRSPDRLLAFLVMVCVIGNSGEVLSHIEGKYFMQIFGLLGIFVGYLAFFFYPIIKARMSVFCARRKMLL